MMSAYDMAPKIKTVGKKNLFSLGIILDIWFWRTYISHCVLARRVGFVFRTREVHIAGYRPKPGLAGSLDYLLRIKYAGERRLSIF